MNIDNNINEEQVADVSPRATSSRISSARIGVKDGRSISSRNNDENINDKTRRMNNKRNSSESSECADPCPICLRRREDEAKLDSCDHRFCFEHICEWLKLNAICPMCKRAVTTVMHNIRDDGEGGQSYDEMSVHELQRLAEQKRIAEMQQQPMDVERRELVLMIRNLRRIIREFDEILLRNERNGIETSAEWSRQRQVCVERCNRYQLLLDSFDRPRREVLNDPTFRLLVYEMDLRRRPIIHTDNSFISSDTIINDFTNYVINGSNNNSNSNNQSRGRIQLTPVFFMLNQSSQKPRLATFIRRDLSVLLRDTPTHAQSMDWIIDRIYKAVCTHQINSPQFSSTVARLVSIRPAYADRFAELLFDFASSGVDLESFDQNSQYFGEDEARRRQLANARRSVNENGFDDVLVDETMPVSRRPRPMPTNPFLRLHRSSVGNIQNGERQPHPINSRSMRWPGRGSARSDSFNDDSSVEVVIEEPRRSARQRSSNFLASMARRNDMNGMNDYIGRMMSAPSWSQPLRFIGSNLFSGSNPFVDHQAAVGEHLAMWDEILRESREGSRNQTTLQTPIVTDVTSNSDGESQNGDNATAVIDDDDDGSESSGPDNEELFFRDECRLRLPQQQLRRGRSSGALRGETSSEVNEVEPIDSDNVNINSNISSNNVWMDTTNPSTSTTYSAAFSSTDPLSQTSQNSASTSGFVLISNVRAGPSTSCFGHDRKRKRRLESCYDEDIVQLDDTDIVINDDDDDEVTLLDAPSASGSGSGRAPVPPAAPPVITLDDEVEEIPVAVERKYAKPAAAPNRDSPRHRKRELGAAPSQKSSKRTRESGAEHQAKMLRYSQILDKYRRKMEQLQRKRPRSRLAGKDSKKKRHERGGAGGARSGPFARLNRQCGSLLEGVVLGEANTQLIAQLAAETTPTELDEFDQNLKRISRVVERIRDWWAEQGTAATGSSGRCPEVGQHSPGSVSDTGTGRTGNSSTGTAKTGSQKGGERNGATRMEEEEETVYERSEGSGEESGVEDEREGQVGQNGTRRAEVAASDSDQHRAASRADSTGPEAIATDQRGESPGPDVQASGKASSGEVTTGSGQPEQSHSGIGTKSTAKEGVPAGSDDVTSERGDNGMEASASARLSKSHAHRGRSHRKRSISEQVICGDDGQDVFEKEGETTRMKAAGTSKSRHSDGRRSHSPAGGKDRDDSPKTEDSDEF